MMGIPLSMGKVPHSFTLDDLILLKKRGSNSIPAYLTHGGGINLPGIRGGGSGSIPHPL